MFDYVNILKFWLIRFAMVEAQKTLNNKLVGWIKNDLEDYLYKFLYIAALTIIIKYNMIKMRILYRDIFQITIVALMYLVLSFIMFESIKQLIKLALIY